MNERVTTWGDLLARRSGQRFVGRRREIEPFRLNFLYAVPPTLVFVVQGPPGIGKSALLAQYRLIAGEHGFVTATVDRGDIHLPQEFGVVQAILAVARRLSAAGVPLTTFSEVHREYTAALRKIAQDPDAPAHAWDLFGGVTDEDAWAVRAWDEYLIKTFPMRRSSLLRDPVGALTERFVKDLNAWATVRRILLCFDDWQQLGGERRRAIEGTVDRRCCFQDWLFDLLSGGELSTNIWFAIADRDPLPGVWDALAPITSISDLRPLSRRDARTLLYVDDSLDEEVAELKLALAEGNPLHLTLVSDGVVEADSPLEAYVAALEPVLRTAVLKCSVARWLDEGVISALLGQEAAARLLAWLSRTPLVTRAAVGWCFLPAVHASLEKTAMNADAASWEAAHQTLRAYYRQRSELHGAESDYLDAEWHRDHVEALYHLLIIGDVPEALSAAMESFLRSIRRFYPWAGAVAKAWSDAADVISARRHGTTDARQAVVAWAPRIKDLWEAFVARDWEAIHTFSETLLTPETQEATDEAWAPDVHQDVVRPPVALSAEIRQLLRGINQLAAGRLALPVEVEDELAMDGKPVHDSARQEQERSSTDAEVPAGADAVLRDGEDTVEDDGAVACELPPEDVAQQQDARPVGSESVTPDGGAPGGDVPDDGVSDAEAAAIEHCGYANGRMVEGAYDAAIEAYDQALTLNPQYIAAYYNRGLAHAGIGALDSAIADFTRAIELDLRRVQEDKDVQRRRLAEAYRQRGLVHARKGAFDQAIADYDAALQHDPDAVMIAYDRANAYFRLQSYERAVDDYTLTLSHAPDHLEAYLNRGLAQAARGEYVEALRDYNRAIALDPQRAITYHHRGRAYARLDRHTEALADYARALELNPRDAAVHNNRGLLYVRIEAYPEAVDSYQRAMAIEPDWATPYYNAACAAALMEDVEHAVIWLSRAIALREGYRTMALKDADFHAIRDAPRFRRLVGLEEH